MRRTAFAPLIALLILARGVLLPFPAAADPSPLAATGLAVSQECGPAGRGAVRVTFTWTPSRGGQQWLDLTLTNNRFQAQTFVGAGPLPTQAATYTWDGLIAGAPHFARVNTLTRDGWASSDTVSFPTLRCPGMTTPPPSSPDLLALRDRLQAEIDSWRLNAAVAVTDLQTGESIDIKGDDPRLPGCTINLFVLMRVVMDLQEGRYPESLVGDLIARTIYSSNPITARDLLLISGGGNLAAALSSINDLMRLLGLEASLYDHPPAYPQETLWGSINVLTANEVNRALAALWEGRVVGPEWRDYLLRKLTGVKPGLQYLIPAGVSNAAVSHKNGFFVATGGWIDNDAGIVTFQRGGNVYAYAISFFTQDVPSKYADIPLGQAVSRLVWQYFDSRYR